MSDTPNQDPIREKIVEARRQQILDASALVFAAKGYHRATIRDIAAQAGIADGTIYNYFENKADLLIGILNHLDEMEVREEQLSGLSLEDFRTMFLALLRDRISLYLSNIDMFKAILPEMLINPELRERYYGQNVTPTLDYLEWHLEARSREGHIRGGNHKLTARAMIAMMIGFLILHILGDRTIQDTEAELPDALATLLYDGLKPLNNKE